LTLRGNGVRSKKYHMRIEEKAHMQNYELTVFFTDESFTVDNVVTQNHNVYYNKDLLARFESDKYQALYDFGFMPKNDEMSPSLMFLHQISECFLNEVSHDSDIEITKKAKSASEKTLLDIFYAVPFVLGIEHINITWIKEVWKKLCDIFDGEVTAFSGSVSEYMHSKNNGLKCVGRVFFHLVENKDADYPFAFLATYSTGSKDHLSHMPIKNALLEYQNEQNKLLALLSTVSRAADRSDFISELVESGELFSPLKFNKDEAYIFLKEIMLYEDCGIVCRIPDWWKRKGAVRLSVSIGGKAPTAVGLDALLNFDPEIYLGDMKMTRDEIEALLSQTSGLSFLKGKWVEVDHEKLQAALAAFDKANSMGELSFTDAMRMQLNVNKGIGIDEKTTVEITNGEWLASIREKLLNPSEIGDLSAGSDFMAILRHYQQTGFNWLGYQKRLRFGALLADDMGLGKTVQILALLEYCRQNGKMKTLLIIPASLIWNWQSETDRFTPRLRYAIIHANNKEFDINEADLFITTYGMAKRVESLRTIHWDLIILDEAQAIKNAGSMQTKAVKELKSKFKIAMTGTPIENRLSDLWSIFDFLNKGLLGSSKEFTDFIKRLKNDSTGYVRLREIVSPFILRRLKTDKAVIADLPDKVEIKEFTKLAKKQVVLYNALVKEIKKNLESASGIERRGFVLAGIMKFKQICNHPDQYLGQSAYDFEHSGKFEKLAEICETIREKRERVLVFTQFKEMTEPLAKYLETLFGRRGLVLHGGTQVKKRGELVEKFNGDEYVPFMVLSIKAGGVGLNLAAANHVIHFDRWWNPAVENQATDRAFRIGQQKNVMVHKFITTGTIEEKIDAMLDEKQKLADDIIVASAENWITEMSNDELLKLFALEA